MWEKFSAKKISWTRSLPINSLLILSALQTLHRASLHELAEKIHANEMRTKANVEKLVEAGLVEAIGNTSARTYILSSKVYRDQDNMAGYVRQTGIDLIKHEELIRDKGTFRFVPFFKRENGTKRNAPFCMIA